MTRILVIEVSQDELMKNWPSDNDSQTGIAFGPAYQWSVNNTINAEMQLQGCYVNNKMQSHQGKKDTGIYKIMQELECLEKSTKNYITDMDYLWGTAAIRVRKEHETEHVLSSDDTYDIEKHQKVNSEITFQLTSECVELLFFSFCMT
ncbi:hypothetical protein Tco_0566862 [Tanacetum coccineum]